METIAPLAKVLAEANGIEWQVIQGSGDGGMITEQDILGYLARVMSGEEDAPTTPVDPEPSPAELAAYASPEMLSRAGVDSDLTEFLKDQSSQTSVGQTRVEQAPVEQTIIAVPEVEAADFELEDEPAAPQIDEAPLADEPPATQPPVIQPRYAEADVPMPVVDVPPVVTPVIPSMIAPQDVPSTPLPSAPLPTTPLPATPPPAPSGSLLGGLLSSLYRKKDLPQPEAAQPAPTRFEPTPPPVPADVVPPISAEPAAVSVPPAPALGEVIEPDVAPAAAAPAVAEPMPVPEVAAPQVQPAAATWTGLYLRREVDMSAMQEARDQLAEVLGELPLTMMVARAAQRHLSLLGLNSLAIANIQGQALKAEIGHDLRSDLKALSQAQPSGHSNGQAELLILDAGALDLDDLHYPQAVTLSLGRVQGGKAALSLSGDLDVQEAARFLAEVAALLATPMKLLV